MPFNLGGFFHKRSLFAACIFVSLWGGGPLSHALSVTEIELKLEQSQYISDAAYPQQSNQYSSFVPSLKSQGSILNGTLASRVDATAIVPMTDEGEFHLIVRDLYARYSSHETLAVSVGRSQRMWSELDSSWGLGLWQPLYRGDYVRPVEMGFTGFFIESKLGPVRLTGFISPWHMPDQSADFEIVNGQVVSGNRWFRAPVSSLVIEHGINRIHYELNKPETKDVLNNEVYAFSALIGDEAQGLWGRFSFADKPMNQFHLAIQTDGVVFLHIDSGEVHPIIHPQVVRHQLTTLEAGYAWDDRHRVFMSVTNEAIRDPKLPEGWDQTELIDSIYAGFGGSMGLGIIGLRQTLFSVSYVEHIQRSRNGSTNIEGRIEASTQRPAFQQLARVGVQHPLYRQKHHRITGSMNYTHSFSDGGDWVSAQINYTPKRQVTWSLGFDVFGAPDDVKGEYSFISSYRNNDRVFGGFSYVF